VIALLTGSKIKKVNILEKNISTTNKNRAQRASIAQETLAILSAGQYKNKHGNIVVIEAAQRYAVTRTAHYTAESLNALGCVGKNNKYKTQIEVVNASTLSIARKLDERGVKKLLCLNFASAKNPGGGFLGGAEAQEENLAKSSGLYPCIAPIPALYDANRQLKSCFYLDDMIYSPSVPVFRDDEYALTDDYFCTSIVTAPAVNCGAVKLNEPDRVSEIEAVMTHRIALLLNLVLYKGDTHLVLGAWGCGVFGNDANDMARYFAIQLLENSKYMGAFEHISFAVLDRKNIGTYDAFRAVFA
jgi:uncharacterized protein (TIGR02452 family)